MFLTTLALGLCLQTPTAEPEWLSALDSISAARIESDVQFLASEALEGRATPSTGLEVAALYIRSRLERLGLEPGAREGFWHEYSLVLQRIDAEQSRIELTGELGQERLEFGEDYFLRSSDLSSLDLRGGLVCVGDGSDEDLWKTELAGRWALFFDERRSPRRTIKAVQEAGGLGIVIVAGEGYRKKSYAERYGPITRGMTEGVVMKPEFKQAIAASTVPRLWLSESGVERLLSLAGLAADQLPRVGQVLDVELHELRVPDGGEVRVRNVCAFLPGGDPEYAEETIVLSAHYDHLGKRGDTVFGGADDNASGTAGLLALAGALAESPPLRRSVLLLWVSGEEKGLWGSEAWAEDGWLPGGARAVANINLDMIGRTGSGELHVTPSRSHSHFNPVAQTAYDLREAEGFDKLVNQDRYWRSSDHFSFASILELPVVYLSSGDHDDYHKASDTADKIDADKIARTARLVLRMLQRLESVELGS